MRQAFTFPNLRPATLNMIETANGICEEYARQGFDLTVRQLYYQFVARGLVPNSDRSYARLKSVVSDGRLAGLIDWSHIKDRTRAVRGNYAGYNNPGEFLDGIASSYIEAIWEDQEYAPEVWVEKEALSSIVQRAAAPDRVPTFACRGYVSQTAMYDAAQRFQRRRNNGVTPVVIHLGDHDPSGIDMTRDIAERLALMSLGYVEVRRIALNMDQVEQYQPPPNPAKLTDSRGSSYVAEYGNESWELDALDPNTLTALIQGTIEEYVDRDLLEERRAHEEAQESRIREVAQRFDDLSDRWDDVLEVIDR